MDSNANRKRRLSARDYANCIHRTHLSDHTIRDKVTSDEFYSSPKVSNPLHWLAFRLPPSASFNQRSSSLNRFLQFASHNVPVETNSLNHVRCFHSLYYFKLDKKLSSTHLRITFFFLSSAYFRWYLKTIYFESETRLSRRRQFILFSNIPTGFFFYSFVSLFAFTFDWTRLPSTIIIRIL